ncbi:hypothetical protein OPT61_g1342 [Boeremia exigua]|uniref:Uncharacterized protein n=1 Tax=Boeremia exigua TaxID=749465 RepID=A0ACC2IQQ5_9PLEO|nr:hypothetical protein OPT61_g1342 [Boeremia exigua]
MQALIGFYLELETGALEILRTLKQLDHNIAVITEGPQDAQERTIKALGIAPYVDYLATTNRLRVPKVDGLFDQVLGQLGLDSEDMIMTGDSWERDIVPAAKTGMYCVHYSEKGRDVTGFDGKLSISALGELQTLVETAHRCTKA